jgi:transposase
MPAKKHIIALASQDRNQIEIVARSYRHSARERTRAKILLLADENQPEGALPDSKIAQQVGCSHSLIEKTRHKAIERGAVESLKHKAQENRKPRKLDGAAEAKLTALATSQAPEGRKTWTLQLLADRLVQMKVVDTISDTTIYTTMKKMHSSLG